MRKTTIFCFIIPLLCCQATSESNTVDLWPQIEPFDSGYLRVSDIHEIYYELSGDPEGTPVFVLHGGPGGSSSPFMRRFFNPEKFLIVMHDQRGAGKSKPFADIRENTTQHLVKDIEQLRSHLNLNKIVLFGGSWGSTLALAYGETYPQNISGMVLRGIFTATKKEIDHFYHGGVSQFYPDVFENFINRLQPPDNTNIPEYLLSLIQSSDTTMQKKYSRLWAEYEIQLSSLSLSDSALQEILNSFDPLAFGLLENYYMANHCFLEEGQLLNQAEKLKDIYIILVNGRYDMICPPVTAYKLHQKLANSKLVIAEESGHWMGEKNIEKALVGAMREFE